MALFDLNECPEEHRKEQARNEVLYDFDLNQHPDEPSNLDLNLIPQQATEVERPPEEKRPDERNFDLNLVSQEAMEADCPREDLALFTDYGQQDFQQFNLSVVPHQPNYGQQDLWQLNVIDVPHQEKEDQNPIQRLPLSNGHVVKYHFKKELPNDKRRQLYEALVWRSINGRLTQKDVNDVAASFSVSERTVWRIWKQANNCLKEGHEIDVSKKRFNCGRKRMHVNLQLLRDIPLSKRTTLLDLSAQLKVSKYKLWKLKKEGLIKRHSNSTKPFLKEDNKKEILRWCISMLDPSSIHTDPTFKDFSDFVFIDEKWFYLTKKTGRYYILPNQEEPHWTCNNKNFTPKVMFLCAIARPRMDNEGNCTFDGKIGCFPLVTYEPARRTIKNL